MLLHTYGQYNLESLIKDLQTATQHWDWSQGAYGHSLSLPSREQLHPAGQDHFNNLPFSNLLDRCPYFRQIFDDFQCDKVSFRLLRRPGRSCYAWHTDKDKGPSIFRFQIPIVTNTESKLVITKYRQYDEFKSLKERLSERDAFLQYDNFKRQDHGCFEEHVLEPGVLYYFDTNLFHNLFNMAPTERITLVMDMKVNNWLRRSYPAIEHECEQK